MTIDTDTEAYALYYQLTVKPETGHVIIGKGEAASIALAKQNNGIVASNNLKDITSYITEMGLMNMSAWLDTVSRRG